MSDANFQIKISVEAQLSQLKAMEAQFERQIVQLRTLGTGGADALKKVESNLSLVRSKLVETASASSTTGTVAGGAFKNIGQVVGQAGYQMQDFAVQVAGGQSALTAFAQQGSQLLGIFGPTGIIAGAVLAVGVLAAKMLNLGDNTETATSKFKTQKEAVDALIKARRELIEINDPSASKTFAAQDVGTAQAAYEAQMKKVREIRARLSKAESIQPTASSASSPLSAGAGYGAASGSAPIAGALGDSDKNALYKKLAEETKKATELKVALTQVQVVDQNIDKAAKDARETNDDLIRSDTERLVFLQGKQAAAEAAGQQNSVEYITRQGQIITLEKQISDEQLKNVGKLAREQINLQINVEDSQRKQLQNAEKLAKAEAQKLATMGADQALSISLAASKQSIASLDADRFKTEAEKAPQRIALLQEENAAIQARIDLLEEENAKGGDPVAAEIRKGKIDSLRSQQGSNNVKVESTQPLGVGGSLAAASTSYMDKIGTVADQVGRAWSNVGQGMSNSLGTAFSDMILKAQSFKDAMAGFGNAILQSMVQAMANMVADWIVSHTVMAAVRSIFHTEDVAQTAVATGAKVAIHTGGEVAQTGATAAGAATRTSIGLWETIVHGLHVAWRTATHIAGEIAKTAATIFGAGVRIGSIIAESIANVWNAAIGALSAMASIPWVGPILAVAAMGAMLGVGFAAVSNIGKFAEGGPVSGAGTGTSDSIPAWLSNGEYVMPADKTAQYRPLLDSMRNGTLNPGQLAAAPAAGGGGGGSPALNSSINLAFFDSRPSAEQWAKSSDGEAHFVDVAQRNSHRISGNG